MGRLETEKLTGLAWDVLLPEGHGLSQSAKFTACKIAVQDEKSFALAAGETLLTHQYGALHTFTLPQIGSPVTAINYGNDGHILLGYKSGHLVIQRAAFEEDDEPFAYRLHRSVVKQITEVGKSLWILFDEGVVVCIKNFSQFLETPEKQAYPLVVKYRLPGKTIKQIFPLACGGLLSIGSVPMIQFFSCLSQYDGDLIADELDAMRIKAKQTAAKMGTAVSSFAKSLWSRNSSDADLSSAATKVASSSMLADKRTIKLAPDFSLDDAERTLEDGEMSPDGRYILIADRFNGRILQFDSAAGLLIRQWKGYRSADCAHIDENHAVFTVPKQMFVEMRDLKKNERLAKLDLAEGFPEDFKDLRLLSADLLAISTPTELQIYRISFNQ